MTGTALTEEQEFRTIYGMDVIEIPTNKPVRRVDLQDAVYKTKKEKLFAVCNAIEEAHAKGQPVLVGTITHRSIRRTEPDADKERYRTRSAEREVP